MVSVEELDNSLEYWRSRGVGNVADAFLYVLCKKWLGTPIATPESVIAFWNKNQQADGSWSAAGTAFPNAPMFATHRVLWGFHLLNAKPAKPLDVFMADYNTLQKVLDYCFSISDLRDAYHVIFGWCLYYWKYPSWLNELFAEIEKDLSWTVSNDLHQITHTLTSYILPRRAFPNLDAMIDKVLSMQAADGSWLGARPVFQTAIALTMLQQILKLHPGHRTAEINNALAKAAVWVTSAYRTVVRDGKTLGYFGDINTIEDALVCGILSAGQSGVLPTNVDMTLADVVAKIQEPPPIPLWKIALLYLSILGGFGALLKLTKKRIRSEKQK